MGSACMHRDEQEMVQNKIQDDGIVYAAWSAVHFVLLSIFACIYKVKVVDKLPKFYPHPEHRPREKGLLSCVCEPDTCLYTTFCMPIVAAKNWDAAGVCSFWPGCFLMTVCTYTPFYPISVIMRAVFSGQVRQKLGYETNCCVDCLTTAFCFPCEVGRESLEVDEELGVRIECCCPHVEPTTARAEEELFHLAKSAAALEHGARQEHASPGVAPRQNRFGLMDEFQKFDHAFASHDPHPVYHAARGLHTGASHLEADFRRGLHFGNPF